MNVKVLALILGLSPWAGATSYEYCTWTDSTWVNANPLGTCTCENQFWMGKGCKEGFWCKDTSGSGCHKVKMELGVLR